MIVQGSWDNKQKESYLPAEISAARGVELSGRKVDSLVLTVTGEGGKYYQLDDAPSLARVAEQIGYDSEAAFSRAFKRQYGMPPGAWRRRAVKAGSAPAFSV